MDNIEGIMMREKSKRRIKISVVVLTIVIIGSVLFGFLINPSYGQINQRQNVLVITKGNDSFFRRSLLIDQESLNVSFISDSEYIVNIDPWIDAVVIFDASLNISEQGVIASFVDNGGSCVIYMGQNLHDNGTLLDTLGILDNAIYEVGKSLNQEAMLFVVANQTHPISQNIAWNSAPNMKIDNMTIIPINSLNSSVSRITDVYPESKNLEIDANRQPALIHRTLGDGNVMVFAGWLEDGANIDFQVWPYFNYLLHAMVLTSLNLDIATFSTWPFSPVPHLTEQIIIGLLVLILSVVVVILFIVIRKKSKSRMDQGTIEALRRQAEEEEKKRIEESKEFEKKLEEHVDLKDDWEMIGTHRQLGGFLFSFFIGLFLVIPQLLVSNFIMPQIIQPYPQAAGWYYYAFNLFQIAWLLFDFGTSFALAKYFSQHRVKNPEKAIHYIQIFVWWQMFTGIIQISIFAFLFSLIFPHTDLAHMSWIFITYSFIQYPGFFLVFMFSFQGMQRADYHMLFYICFEVVFLLIGQVVFVYLGRLWGAANPIFGEALGAGIGYAIARLFDFWMTFILSLVVFKKLGFSPKTCFRVDFNKGEIKETMRYGSRLAFGESFVQIGYFVQIIITSAFIANYSNELGYFNLAITLGQIVQIVTLYSQALLGAYSESSSHNKSKLTKLYIYQAFRWGNYFAYFIISALLATGAKFLVGAAGEEYGGPAVKFLIPLLIFHAAGIYSWLVDAVLQGTGRTGYAALVWIIEQTARIVIMFILVITLRNMMAVLIAYIPAVALKDIIAWWIVRKKITTFNVYAYKTFLTPAIAATINAVVLFIVGEVIWAVPMGDKIINTALIFILGMLVFIFFFGFLDGLLGGYDDNTLKEFEKASQMVKTPFIRFFPHVLYKVAKLGCRISPLHNKFKVDIYEEGMEEARELTMEKKILTI